MPHSRQDEIADKRKSHNYTPYNQQGRRSKMTSSSSWSPSIWNALTFWKRGAASTQEEEEELEQDAADESDGGAAAQDCGAMDLNDDGHQGPDISMASNVSEDQVFALLALSEPSTLPEPRHVRFSLPGLDQDRPNPHPLPQTPVMQRAYEPYVAPLPPSSPLHRSGTQKDPITQVSEYLDNVVRPRGDGVSNIEALGLSSLLLQSVHKSDPSSPAHSFATPQDAAAFFATVAASTSASPSSSPIRPTFTRPDTDPSSLLATTSSPASPAPSPSSGRTLSRNPNGTLYYQGGGSSRPSRYRSPAFGTSPSRKKVTFPRDFGDSKPAVNGAAASPSDGKRRRVGEDSESSSAQASGSSPARTNGINGTQAAPPPSLHFGISASSRFMTSTPARPSPLRQSMRAESSSPGSPKNGDTASPSRSRASEKASEIMAGIINDATPKKDPVPDLRNPYQTKNRSPTKRSRKPAPLPPPRPVRQQPAPLPPQPKKLTALETIQRTAPHSQVQTGSKKTHMGMPPPPPPPMNGRNLHTALRTGPGSSPDTPFVIEADDDEEERPPAKKQRQATPEPEPEPEKEKGKGKEKERIEIEVEDVDMDNVPAEDVPVEHPSEVVEPRQPQLETKRPVLAAGPFKKAGTARFQSTPKEPSPLRQSFQPDTPPSPLKEDVTTSATSGPSAPGPASNPFGISSTANPFGTSSIANPFGATSTTTSAASRPSALSPASNPFGTSSTANLFGGTSTTNPFGTVPVANPFATVSMVNPFGTTPKPNPFGTAPKPNPFEAVGPSALPPAPAPAKPTLASTDDLTAAKQQALDVSSSSLPTFAFVITTTSNAKDDWSAAKAQALAMPPSKLPTFDFNFTVKTSEDRAALASPAKGFDWAAAGMKPLGSSSSGWKCSMCMLENPSSADKCTICAEPRAASAPAPAPAKGFNWAAAGMKPPGGSTSGWKCSMCMLDNPPSVDKCTVCAEAKV